MAKLRNIIGCILNEFTQAQHLANNYAARLGKQYAENDLLRYFMIPNASASGMTFNLKFAVNPVQETETVSEINYQKLLEFFTQLSVSVTETVITTALYASEESVLKNPNSYRKLKNREQVLRTAFQDYLSGVLRDELVKKGINEVDTNGNIDHNRIFEIAMEVINRKFFEHPELNLQADGDEHLNEIRESCSSFVDTLVVQLCRRVNVLETRQEEMLDISVDTETLSKTAPENLQQISFDVNLRNYQISRMDTENGSRDCIIPANN
ncbi:MAG: hypothetical protein LBJ72_11215 [Dysgonamonadaceae bacterium]|jgi:hypothetical protein|nr:hypothetical protein [Dysgonamonadaceae bacterium]